MRINTDGQKEYRTDMYERTADVFDESTKTGGIDAACMHARQDIEAKEEAIEYLAGELPPKQLQKVADLLSTEKISVSVETDATINVR